MRRRSLCFGAALSVFAATSLMLPAGALAHGLSAKADLPIPAWLFAWAATIILMASFAGLAVLWRQPVLAHIKSRDLVGLGLWLDVILGAIGVAWFALVCWAGLTGVFVPTANLAPTAVWVAFWVGMPIASAIFGNVFNLLNPWRAVGRAVGWFVSLMIPEGLPKPKAWPDRVGRLPAAVGLLLMGWLELASVSRDDPQTLAVLALMYAAVQLVGMSLRGVEAWTSRGDSFAVAFELVSRIAPFERVNGRLLVRVPLSALSRVESVAWTQAVLLVVIGTTTFDGFTQGPLWADAGLWLRDRFEALGLGLSDAAQAASTVGLLAAIALVSCIWFVGAGGASSTLGIDRAEGGRQFLSVLVPIALAYTVAHYISFLLLQGQSLGFLISDPLGNGSDWFGTASATVDYGLIGPTAVWWVQVAALVTGHVAALMLAHDRALELAPDLRTATRSQVPMLVAAVAFTVLGLWLLSAANL